jgi:hypothetical protein
MLLLSTKSSAVKVKTIITTCSFLQKLSDTHALLFVFNRLLVDVFFPQKLEVVIPHNHSI